jgi:hypothetical protein
LAWFAWLCACRAAFVRLLGAAPRLLGLLTRTVRLVQSQLDSVADPLQILADVFPGGQFTQLMLVLALLAVLTSRLYRGLYIVCLGHVALLILLSGGFLYAGDDSSGLRTRFR